MSRTDVTGVHHIGLAVRNVRAAASRYALLFGARVDHEARVEDQGIHALALRLPEGPLVELLAPIDEDTPVGRFLARRGEGMHHVAYGVDDIDAALDRLAVADVELIDRRPRAGLFGLQVAFIHPEAAFGVLSELVQRGEGSHG